MSGDEMAGQPPEEAGQAPAPGAAPVPDFPGRANKTGQEAPVPAVPQDPSARAAELVDELAQIRAGLAPGDTVMLRVMPPHDSFTRGVTVGADPTPVPVHAVPQLMTAAAEAGVTLEEA